jgi:hypothetical protein
VRWCYGDDERQWRNGGRRLIVAFGVSVAVIIVLNTWMAILLLNRPFAPLRNEVPQIVVTTEVRPGEVLVTRGTKCNITDEAVVVLATSYLVPIEPAGPSILSSQGQGLREPGCLTREFRRTLPEDLKPGTYRVVGTETVVADAGRSASLGWYSEAFLVLPK